MAGLDLQGREGGVVPGPGAHRRYLQILLGLIAVPLLGLLALHFYIEPLNGELNGDIVRLGSYAARDYGWQAPHPEFIRPLAEIDRYDRHFDVVVLGDSFSWVRPPIFWENFFAAATGWSIVALNTSHVTFDKVLANRNFRQTPPRLFIFEAVERNLPPRIKDSSPCDAVAIPGGGASIPWRPVTAASADDGKLAGLTRTATRSKFWGEINLSYLINYVGDNLARAFLGGTKEEVLQVDLATPAPFSSSVNNRMLIYKDDFAKVAWWRQMGMPEITCRIERMRRRVEANGRTRFILMVPPDKLTAYSAFIRDRSLRDVSALSALADRLPQVTPRLDLAIKAAIRRGVQDVYLPDDVHWGWAGNRIAADAMLAFLRQREPAPAPHNAQRAELPSVRMNSR